MAIIQRTTNSASSQQMSVLSLPFPPIDSSQSVQPDADVQPNEPYEDCHERLHGSETGRPNTASRLEDALDAWKEVTGVSINVGRYLLKSRITSARKKRKTQGQLSSASITTPSSHVDTFCLQAQESLRNCGARPKKQQTCAIQESREQKDGVGSSNTDKKRKIHDISEDVRRIRLMAIVLMRLQMAQNRFGNDMRGVLKSLPSPPVALARGENRSMETNSRSRRLKRPTKFVDTE